MPAGGAPSANVEASAPLTAPVDSAPVAKGKRTVRRQVTAKVVDAANTTTVETTKVVDTDEAELPPSVKLAAPYAFYDDDGQLHSWLQGSEISDADTIALLVDRGAIFEAE